jgi:hypothetical protein
MELASTPTGFHKIMVDGAVSRSGHKGSVGAICRRHDDVYVGAAARVFSRITDPAVLETVACREALYVA